MVKGLPDRELFFNTVGKIVDTAKQAAWNAQRGLTAFGEMVAVLWEKGNYSGALQLEALWNELLNERAFHLHCAYPKWLFPERGGELAAAICESHSHVIGQPAAA